MLRRTSSGSLYGNGHDRRRAPGKLVGLGLGSTRGMKKGRYTITASLVQAGKRTSVTLR